MDEKFYGLLEKVYAELLSTREDIKDLESRMATKEDLKDLESRMATKEDLKDLESRMATKEDLELAVEELKTEAQTIYDELKDFRQDFNMLEVRINKNALDISIMKLAR